MVKATHPDRQSVSMKRLLAGVDAQASRQASRPPERRAEESRQIPLGHPGAYQRPARVADDFDQDIELDELPDEDRRFPAAMRRPAMLVATAFVSALVTAALFWSMFGAPSGGETPATVAREAAAGTAAPRPQPSPPVAVTALATTPNLAAAAPAPSRLAAAGRLHVDRVLTVPSGARVALPIRLEPPTAPLAGARIVLRGLPADAIVPRASRGPEGSVVLPVEALPSGILDMTNVRTGDSQIEIELQGKSGEVLDRATAVLTIAPNMAAPRAEPQSNRLGENLVTRGRALFASGDVAGARLMLERAVEVGSATAAFVLAETFDPLVLAGIGVRGMQPDVRQARFWYERARNLGVANAHERLRRLPQQ